MAFPLTASTSEAPNPALGKTLRLSVIEGCFAMLPGTFTGGVFLTGFALLLHADAWALGLLAAIPALGQAAQLAAAALLAQGERRKRLCVWCASASRYLWLPIALLPFTPIADAVRLEAFFVLLALATVLGQMAGVAWTSWMGDLVPADTRGRYFGFRNAVNAGVGMAAVWAGTNLMSAFKHDGREAAGFLVLVLLATAGSLASQLALTAQAAPPAAPSRPPARLLQTFRVPLKDRHFMRTALPLVAWALVVNLTSPFVVPYALQDLHLDYSTLGLYTLVTSAVGIGSQLFWGRWIDRLGARKALAISMAPISFHPWLWLPLKAGFTAPLAIDAFSTGFFWTGFSLATFALLLERAPRGEQAPYVSLFNTVCGVATGIGALLGAAVLARFAGHAVLFAGFTLAPMQALLVPSTLLRFACFVAFVWVTRPSRPTVTIDVWPVTAAEAHVPRSVEALNAN